DSNRLVVLDSLSRSQRSMDLALLVPTFGRDENSNWLSDRFHLRISENTSCPGAPTGNNSVQILKDNRIFRSIDNGGEPEPCGSRRRHVSWFRHSSSLG